MNKWLKIALLTATPVVASAHSVSPFLLPEVFDTKAATNVSFQSALTVEKFFVASNNFKTSYAVTEPDGQEKVISAAASLKRFNVGEFELPKEGTYRVRTVDATGNSTKYALVDGRWLRVRPVRVPQANAPQPQQQAPQAAATTAAKPATQPATPAQPPRMIAADKVPENAQTLEVKTHIIAETFVTKAKPSKIPEVTNKGFEVKLITHPNELFAGESLKGQVIYNGQPVKDLEVDIFKGASSYDVSAKREMPHVKTNAKGEFEVKFDQAGIYLIAASYPEGNPDNTKKPQAETFTYGLTVEVVQ